MVSAEHTTESSDGTIKFFIADCDKEKTHNREYLHINVF